MSLVGFKAKNHPQQIGSRGANLERDNLGTDPVLFAELDKEFRFSLDVAAAPENAKCERFYTEDDNGLHEPWNGRIWCNPPYSNIRAWVEKAWSAWESWELCDLIVMLLPANRCEQAWWQDLVEPHRDQDASFTVRFLRGRRRFVLPGQETIGANERPPFGCCLLIWQRVA